MEKITELKAGQRVRVYKIRGPGELHRKLRSLGISVGREIEIRIATPTKTTLMVKVGISVLPLAWADAEGIYVEPVVTAAAKNPAQSREAALKEAKICP